MDKSVQSNRDVWEKCLSEAKERLIVALDAKTLEEVYQLIAMLGPDVRWFKVGMSAFYAGHRPLLQTIQRYGARIFLDLKLHDIPSTVARTVHTIADLGVSWLTLHALGGEEMLIRAREAVDQQIQSDSGERLKLFAVTVLTSHDRHAWEAIGMSESPEQSTERLARLALRSGMDGLIAAPTEVYTLSRLFGRYPYGPYLVTPGVRLNMELASPDFSESKPLGQGVYDDQVRIATPEKAIQDGGYAVVVGRPIIAARDPRKAYGLWLEHIARALLANDPQCLSEST